MVDIGTITSGLEAFGAIHNLVRKLGLLTSDQQVKGEIQQLNSLVMTAQGFAVASQTNEMEMAKRVAKLEQELAKLKAFRREKENYKLTQVFPGAFVYVYHPPEGSTQVDHWLCCNCFDNDKKSILQRAGKDRQTVRQIKWKCPTCDAQVRMNYACLP